MKHLLLMLLGPFLILPPKPQHVLLYYNASTSSTVQVPGTVNVYRAPGSCIQNQDMTSINWQLVGPLGGLDNPADASAVPIFDQPPHSGGWSYVVKAVIYNNTTQTWGESPASPCLNMYLPGVWHY